MTSVISVRNNQEYFTAATLKDICIHYCVTNAKTTLLTQSDTGKSKLRQTIHLPTDVWESILQGMNTLAEDYPALIYAVLRKLPTLRKIHIRNCIHLKDDELQLIMECYPVSLDIHNCPTLTKKSTHIINKFGKNLECLCFGSTTQIIPTNIENWLSTCSKLDPEPTGGGIRKKIAKSITRFFTGCPLLSNDDSSNFHPHGLLNTPKLRKLIIWGHHISQMQQVQSKILFNQESHPANSGSGGDSDVNAKTTVDYWEYVTRDFIQNLEYLDLSSCQEVLEFSFLLEAKDSLQYLYLHDVLLDYDQNTWGVLKHFTKLKFLDVSQYNELASVFANPDIVLNKLVTSLPQLVGLDISGTNLAGFDFNNSNSPLVERKASITGLVSRESKPLQFLGLLATHYNASSRSNIPALEITGGDSIEQLLLALKRYMYRANILRKTVRILHAKLVGSDVAEFLPCYSVLDLLLEVLSNHINDKHTVIVSLAACFHAWKKVLYRTSQQRACTYRVKKAFTSVIRAMQLHSPQDLSLLRNGVLNLLLIVPYVEMNQSNGKDLISALLRAGMAAQNGVDVFAIKAIAHMLYMVMHFEEGKLLEHLKNTSVPEELCEFMDALFKKQIYEQMSTFWILLLKFIFDKNTEIDDSSHYERFSSALIVDLCFKLVNTCYNPTYAFDGIDTRPYKQIVKPVLAFLTNCLYKAPAAEKTIVTSSNVQVVVSILNRNPPATDHELSHLCCGFLAQVVSKKESYELISPTRMEILTAIHQIMNTMSLSDKFTFKFRNLSQLYELLELQDAPEAQLWALWTLVKLSQNDPTQFLDMALFDDKLTSDTIYNESDHKLNECRCSMRITSLRKTLSSFFDENAPKKNRK